MRSARFAVTAAAAVVALAALSACSHSYALRAISPGAEAAVEAAVARVSLSRMDADLGAIETGQDGLGLYRGAYAAKQLALLGLAVVHVAKPEGIDRMDDFYAEIPGADPGLAPVFLEAHWDKLRDESDTYPGSPRLPGMDDNASGLVGVVECARAAMESGIPLRRTLRFVFFDREEDGLLGSKHYASTLGSDRLPSFFVNFEMIAYTADKDPLNILAGQERGDWIGAYAPDWAADCVAEFARAARLFVPGLKYYAAGIQADFELAPLLANIGRSDHLPFWKRGAPGLMLTDGAEMRNPNYHREGDSKSSLDLAFMTKVVAASLATALLRAEPL